MDQNKEKIIGKIIHNQFHVEWMRYNMFSSENIYKNIPFLVFRLCEDDLGNQVTELQKCIANFEGKMKWKLFIDPLSKKENYLLTLAIMENVRKECLEKGITYDEQLLLGKEKYAVYCEQAIQDIPLLASHIEDYFKQSN